MTINFEKFLTEVEREIRENLSTKSVDNWKDDYEADCLYQNYCDDISEYEDGLTEEDDKNGMGFSSHTGKQYFEACEHRYELHKKLFEAWNLNLDFMEVTEVSVIQKEMSWEIYYGVMMNNKSFDIKVEIKNGVVTILHNKEELDDDDALGSYTNLSHYKLIQILKNNN
jgi:hypothetical protein